MLLKPGRRLAGLIAAASLLGLSQMVQAQQDWQLRSTAQLGADAWHIDHSAQDKVTRDTLSLADSATHWDFRTLSPWYTLHSQLDIGGAHHVVLRTRANQGLGGKLDQLYYDHAISPSLGLRAGVADYRATWCREYDLDNPWVREIDPFCSHRIARLPTSSAPALQTYANLELGNYQIQGLAGLFRPRAFGYAPREFGGADLPDHVHITRNHKHSLSLNAVHRPSSTEWRISWTGLDQRLFDPLVPTPGAPWGPIATMNYHQTSNVFFAGTSWQLGPRLRARLTHMTSSLRAHCMFIPPARTPASRCEQHVTRASSVVELNYQLGADDQLALAWLDNPIRQAGVYERRHQQWAAGWRRDWGAGWFTAVQLVRSDTHTPYNNDVSKVRFIPGKASAWGSGLRVGYQL